MKACLLSLMALCSCDAIAGHVVALSTGDGVAQVVHTASKIAPPSEDRQLRRFLDAIRRVETGATGIGAVGDGGRALGPYQIHKAYWQDSGVPGRYEDCLRDTAYSERVVLAYMKRYAPKALAAGDWETLARIHNGGPKGHTKKATLGYWAKVQKEMGK